MKKLIFLFLFVGLCLSINARPVPKLTFKNGSPNIILLKVSALNNAIQVVFQDSEGGLLFTETLVKGYTYKKNYDLSEFSNADYFVKVVEAKNVKFFKITKGEINKITELDKLPFE